jgi:hypothetical protein
MDVDAPADVINDAIAHLVTPWTFKEIPMSLIALHNPS